MLLKKTELKWAQRKMISKFNQREKNKKIKEVQNSSQMPTNVDYKENAKEEKKYYNDKKEKKRYKTRQQHKNRKQMGL